jgi:hypothetical protein
MDPAVQHYIDSIPDADRPLFDRLQSLILELYPDAEVTISYQIPTYKVGRRRVYLGCGKMACRWAPRRCASDRDLMRMPTFRVVSGSSHALTTYRSWYSAVPGVTPHDGSSRAHSGYSSTTCPFGEPTVLARVPLRWHAGCSLVPWNTPGWSSMKSEE